MSYADLIEKKLHTLPKAKQAEVFDFVEFLASRNQAEQKDGQSIANSPLSDKIKKPIHVDDFTPLGREAASARNNIASDILAVARAAQASFPKQDNLELQRDMQAMRGEWERKQ